MMCAVFLSNERILKFRILVEMMAQIQMLKTNREGGEQQRGEGGGLRELFSLLFITCEMLSPF